MVGPDTYWEKETCIAAAAGNREAFATIFHYYKDRLYSFLLRLTESPEMTEDVIQDIFLRLWAQKERLKEIDNLGSYLFRMAQNQCINYFKRAAKETLILAELKKEVFGSGQLPDAEEKLAAAELQKKLAAGLARLSPRQLEIYRLSREQGMKHEEIAAALGISVSTVKNHMIEALRNLREWLLGSTDNVLLISCFLAIVTAFEK